MRSKYYQNMCTCKKTNQNVLYLVLYFHLILPETINDRTLENDRPRVFVAIQT
jgi:hypothetical protein